MTYKATKPNFSVYKNKLSKIIKYDIFNEKIQNDIIKFMKKYFVSSQKIIHNKKEVIFKPNKARQKVLSTKGNEFDIPALIMNLLMKNNSISIVIDSSYSIFNTLCLA